MNTPQTKLEKLLELTWFTKGLRPHSDTILWMVSESMVGIDLIYEGITTLWYSPVSRLWLYRWNWPDLRRDYDILTHRSISLAGLRVGIDLIYEGITTTNNMSRSFSAIKSWNWPDLRRDYDRSFSAIKKDSISLELTWFTKGLRRGRNSSGNGLDKFDVGIDLIYEGITTAVSYSADSSHAATSWNWPDLRRDYDHGFSPFIDWVYWGDVGIDLIYEGITTRLTFLYLLQRRLLGWNWPDLRRDYDLIR